MEEKNITSIMGVPMMWSVIDKKDYQKYHIISTNDVTAVCSWFASTSKDSKAIVTLYDYGNNKKLVAEIDESFKQIKQYPELQEQYNIFPVFTAKGKVGGKQVYLSALKTFDFTSVAVDVYFVYAGNNYALHTVVDNLVGDTFEQVVASNQRIGKICEVIQSL